MINLEQYGFTPSMLPDNENGTPARVSAVHKERYELICSYGEIYGRLKGSVYYAGGDEEYPTTGDYVLIDYNPDGDSRIVKTLERKSKFARSDFSGHAVGYVKTVQEQVVAANFDTVFIMQSLNHDLNIKRLERYLTLAWQSGAEPVILLTKADLVDDFSAQMREIEEAAMGVRVYAVSAKTGSGLQELRDYLQSGRTIVFLGSSGVGKSSLVNALAGRELMTVKEIREDDSRGRHTTTHRQLLMLPSGVMIIDTPGMRELGMWNVSSGLEDSFNDVQAVLGCCRFSDCTHRTEPGCAVQAALADGTLSPRRWESYLQIKGEAKFADDKSAFIREKTAKNKNIAMKSKEMKKKGIIRK